MYPNVPTVAWRSQMTSMSKSNFFMKLSMEFYGTLCSIGNSFYTTGPEALNVTFMYSNNLYVS